MSSRKTPLVLERLTALQAQVGKRLDRIGGLMPTLPHVNEVAYLEQAQRAAQVDPEFGRAFDMALRQYHAVRQAPPGGE